jgi:hypothetical protein
MSLVDPMTSIECTTPEDVKKVSNPIRLPKGCTMSDHKANGKEISCAAHCDESTVKYRLTVHSPDSISGTTVSHGEDPSPTKTMKFAGRRTGEACSAKELAEDTEDDALE